MRNVMFYVISSVLAAVVPFLQWDRVADMKGADFPGWPDHFEGRSLKLQELSEREQRFAADFPGKIAKFSDGQRTIIMRWVTRETRKLHPAADCFRGAGNRVENLLAGLDSQQSLWGRFNAVKGNESFQVSERISDDQGNGWADVSAWYWTALLRKSTGPWWAITIVDSIRTNPIGGTNG
jgi:hypothetical protein